MWTEIAEIFKSLLSSFSKVQSIKKQKDKRRCIKKLVALYSKMNLFVENGEELISAFELSLSNRQIFRISMK